MFGDSPSESKGETMSIKSIATGVAAVAAIGAAAAGVSAMAPAGPAAYQVQPVGLGAPLPQDTAASMPSAGQLTGILNSLADPSVPFANKSNLVEGGISGTEAHMADHQLKKA